MTQDGALELWGGVECTVNRVGERYFDQVRKSGHHDRPEDIGGLIKIGFRAVRYPVLWERVAPGGLSTADWAWTDERLALLRGAGIRPVATLLHHGSGPQSTHLLDPTFPESFAAYAAAVAARYPWLQDYTPVNEPLTTARFSALRTLVSASPRRPLVRQGLAPRAASDRARDGAGSGRSTRAPG